MDNRLQAHHKQNIFYFTLVDKKPTAVTISMYNAIYTFVQVGDRWINHNSNNSEMSADLIAAVMVAVGEI